MTSTNQRLEDAIFAKFPWLTRVDEKRQDVIIELAIRLAADSLASHKTFIDAVEYGDYRRAADMIADKNLSDIMRHANPEVL